MDARDIKEIGSEQLELLMKKLKGIQGVMDVKRPTG